jgi:hypothetical protein
MEAKVAKIQELHDGERRETVAGEDRHPLPPDASLRIIYH